MSNAPPATCRRDDRKPDAIAALIHGGAHVAHLCDLLEAIADDLPRRSPPIWHQISELCRGYAPQHYDHIRKGLIPLLGRRLAGDVTSETLLAQLEADYADVSMRLPELREILTEGAQGAQASLSPDALGYALRSFFEANRRQIMWERRVLLPLASQHFTEADLASLAEALASQGVSRAARHAVANVAASGHA